MFVHRHQPLNEGDLVTVDNNLSLVQYKDILIFREVQTQVEFRHRSLYQSSVENDIGVYLHCRKDFLPQKDSVGLITKVYETQHPVNWGTIYRLLIKEQVWWIGEQHLSRVVK